MPINFFDIGVTDSSSHLRTTTLLGCGLSAVVLPRSFQLPFAKPSLVKQWLTQIQSGQIPQATSSLLTSCAVSESWTPSQVACTLQQAAQVLMSLNAVSQASRCMQESLASLASSREQSRAEFEVQRWMTLSSLSVAKQDWETAELWMRQSSRTLTGSAAELTASALSHYLGDLLAIQACLRFKCEDDDAASTMLLEAHRAHSNAGSSMSAALDLILQSRSLRAHKPLTAMELLERAKRTVETIDSTPHNIATCDSLLRVCQDDLALLRIRPKRPVAAWN